MVLTRKLRMGIVASAVWGMFTLAASIGENDMGTFLIIGVIPLLIIWGCWWIGQADTTEPEDEPDSSDETSDKSPLK